MELVVPGHVVLLGEGMLELSRDGGHWRLGYGGDTLNTAVHLARYGHQVAYATALGLDPFSDDLRAAWKAEGLNTDLILTDPFRQAGLYAIRTDEAGERSFFYWRNDSAARGLFSTPGIEALVAAIEQADWLCYSLISLAILPAEAREQVYALSASVRARGGRVVFDGNYRPRLWESREAAVEAHRRAVASCDVGLPTLEDEQALWGATDAASVIARWRDLGVGEVAVKLGAKGCQICSGEVIPPPAVVQAIDTSGAGDAFNAGYLHARIAGLTPERAALAGHALAGWVVSRPGALPTRAPDSPYTPSA